MYSDFDSQIFVTDLAKGSRVRYDMRLSNKPTYFKTQFSLSHGLQIKAQF